MTVHEWLAERVAVIKEAGHGQTLALYWPEGVPTLRQSTEHSEVQYELIEGAIARVETMFRLPFAPPDPRTAREPEPPPLPPVIDLPEAGPDVDDHEIFVLQCRYNDLDSASREAVRTISELCETVGASITMYGHRDLRRFLILSAVVAWAGHPLADIFDAVAQVSGCDDDSDAGLTVGTLTIPQATRLGEMAQTTKEQMSNGIR